jgi:hypothetical protein
MRLISSLAFVILAPWAASAAAQLSANPASLDFGGQSMGTTSPSIDMIVTNMGGAAATVSNVAVGDGQFVQANDCTTLAPGGTCTVHVSFMPAIAAGDLNATFPANSALLVTSDAPGSPLNVPLTGIGERSLVAHYYRSILRRAPDAAGKKFWQTETLRLAGMDANVNEAWFAMAAFFYFGAEYATYNRNNAGFVTDLYNTFFNRAPDASGLAFWTDQLAQGMPREVVLASFMFSAEFHDFTSAIFGDVPARPETDAVMDFYRGLLARLPEDSGLAVHAEPVRDAQCNGPPTAPGLVTADFNTFLTSTEYRGRNRTNAQYVGDLYNAILRRGGDLQGVQFFIAQLNGGASRDSVAKAIMGSSEFQARLATLQSVGCAMRGTGGTLGSNLFSLQGLSVMKGSDALPLVTVQASLLTGLRFVWTLHCNSADCGSGSTQVALDGPFGNGTLGAPDGTTATRPGLAADGMPFIAYSAVAYTTNAWLLHATRCGVPDCTGLTSTSFLQGDDFFRGELSMIDGQTAPDGRPLFAYAGPGIVLEKCADAACSGSTRVGFGPGYKPGLALGADNLPLVAFDSTADMRVVKCGDAACASGNTLAVIDPEVTGIPQRTLSDDTVAVAIGLDGLPVIAYAVRNVAVSPPRLVTKLVKCGNATCSSGNVTTEIDSAHDGTNISLVVPADGRPILAYRSASQNTLKVIRCGNAACSAGNSQTTIPALGTPTLLARMTLGASGKPFIVAVTSPGGASVLRTLACASIDCR